MAAEITYPSYNSTARNAGLRVLEWRQYSKVNNPFRVVTADGVELRGVHLRGGFPKLLIYCHGFLSGKNYLPIKRWAEALAQTMDVIVFDFRGHGESGGATTMGELEVLDLDAVVKYAQSYDYEILYLMGSSMGGAIVIRYAAGAPEIGGVITLGTFAHTRLSRAAMMGFEALRLGFMRDVVRWSYATRIERAYPPYNPREYISRIAPRPVLLLHGELDPMIPTSHARELYTYAGEPKELQIIPRAGHDAENLNEHTKTRILKWMNQRR